MKHTTQLQQFTKALVALSVNVTAEDKKLARNLYNELTVIKYLKGKGTKLDITVALLDFFKRRIEERNKMLGG